MVQTKLRTETVDLILAEDDAMHLVYENHNDVVRGSSATSSQTAAISVVLILVCNCGVTPVINVLIILNGADC